MAIRSLPRFDGGGRGLQNVNLQISEFLGRIGKYNHIVGRNPVA